MEQTRPGPQEDGRISPPPPVDPYPFIYLFISVFSCRGPQGSSPCWNCRGEVCDVTYPMTSWPWRQSRAGLPNSCGSPVGVHGRQRRRSPPAARRGGGCGGAVPLDSGCPPVGNVGLRGGGKMQAAQRGCLGQEKKSNWLCFPDL